VSVARGRKLNSIGVTHGGNGTYCIFYRDGVNFLTEQLGGERQVGGDQGIAAEPRQSAVSASPEHIAVLLASLILADGRIEEGEVALARRACDEFSVPIALLDAELAKAPPESTNHFIEALQRIENHGSRERLATILFEIASVDENLDDREARLLEIMRQAWGVSITFLNKPITWDQDQKRVVEATRADRILVSAGPGMGKTAVACARVAYLVEHENVSDTNTWLVSFTRSAIAELKGRIGDFAEDPSNVFAVKISTIDSQAWKVRYGFSPEMAEKLFGGFETGIEAATALMDERTEDFREAFADLEHLIVDEAQDITGGRAKFLLKLIALLPDRCGVTVFHDPAQAIYDYAAAGEDLFRFTDGLRAALGLRLKEESLKKIYRTEEPSLLKLYEDLRLDILGNADVSPENFKSKADIVKKAASTVGSGPFKPDAVSTYRDALVLFRRRMEVAQASAFMAGDGIPHRLRMSGLPRMPLAWLALVLGSTEGRHLSKSTFIEKCQAARETYPANLYGEDIEDNSPERRWDRLLRYARTPTGEVDLFKLRSRLASAPPDEFVMPEFGHEGPILGTIHASKGREADHVFLQINDNWGIPRNDRSDLSEEARVLFVGATRAKRSLAVQGGFAMQYAQETESGRGYRRSPKYKNGLQFQVGLQGDYDPYSAARLSAPIASFTSRALPFKCRAQFEEGTYVYTLRTETGEALGCLSQRLNYDMFEIARKDMKRGRKPASKIENLYVMGFASMIAAPTDDRLTGTRADAASSGFWLVPQIVGLPMVFLSW
jgi:uncharacterized tellurite resistance protein B-like protein